MSRRACRGISTPELLVGSMLSLMTVAVMFSTFKAQSRAFAAQTTYSQSQTVTRTMIDLMTREMRMIAYDPTGGAIPNTVGDCPGVKAGITIAQADAVRFRQDLNADGDVADASEVVTYSLDDDTVLRQDGDATALVLVEGVTDDGLEFRYYDGANPPTELVPAGSPAALTENQRNCVAKIRITAHAELRNPNPEIEEPIASAAQSEIAIRNLSLTNF